MNKMTRVFWSVTLIGVSCLLLKLFVPVVRPSPAGLIDLTFPIGILLCVWIAVTLRDSVGYRARWLSGMLQSVAMTLSIVIHTDLLTERDPLLAAVVLTAGIVLYSFAFMFTTSLWGRLGRSSNRTRVSEDRRCCECDYNLHGLNEPRCPECGTPFDPSWLASDGQSRADRDAAD